MFQPNDVVTCKFEDATEPAIVLGNEPNGYGIRVRIIRTGREVVVLPSWLTKTSRPQH